MAKNRVIGHAGGLPWHLPEDLKHFRAVTSGHAIIMGRRTHASIGRALPERRNIVLSATPGYTAPGCEVAHSLDEALALARALDPEPRVIGGATLYRQALPLATRIYLTEVDREPTGDTRFPELDATEWEEIERRPGDGVAFVVLARR